MTGLARSHISEMETGKRKRPSFETVQKLAGALRVDPSEITGAENRTAALVREEVRRQLQRARRVTAVSDQSRGIREAPELTYGRDEADIWGPAAAARIIQGHEPNEDRRDTGKPPPEHDDDLGPDPIGIEIEGWSLIGTGIYEGDLAWVNPDEELAYSEG